MALNTALAASQATSAPPTMAAGLRFELMLWRRSARARANCSRSVVTSRWISSSVRWPPGTGIPQDVLREPRFLDCLLRHQWRATAEKAPGGECEDNDKEDEDPEHD